jgi:hypothetical protein
MAAASSVTATAPVEMAHPKGTAVATTSNGIVQYVVVALANQSPPKPGVNATSTISQMSPQQVAKILAENAKLQDQVTELKAEKSKLKNQILSLEKEVSAYSLPLPHVGIFAQMAGYPNIT